MWSGELLGTGLVKVLIFASLLSYWPDGRPGLNPGLGASVRGLRPPTPPRKLCHRPLMGIYMLAGPIRARQATPILAGSWSSGGMRAYGLSS